MPKFKVLSGDELIKIFQILGFEIVNQRGSHIKITRMVNGVKQTLVIPNHKEMDKGTLKAIYRQASKYISEIKLKNYFYD
jgi:predicted RNA binding protein YcfA (HicA-like mRNA interferase family)